MEAEAVAIKCWNAYIEEHGKKPSTVGHFQEWLSKSNHHRNISYSKSYDIYDEYSNNHSVDEAAPEHVTKDKMDKFKPSKIQTNVSQSPRNTNYYDKHKSKPRRNEPQKFVFSDTSTTMTPPSPESYHPPQQMHVPPKHSYNKFQFASKTPPATRTRTSAYPTAHRRASGSHEMYTRQASYQIQQTAPNPTSKPRNLRSASSPTGSYNTNNSAQTVNRPYFNNYNKGNTPQLHHVQSVTKRTVHHQNDLIPVAKHNASLGIQTASKIIKTVSVSPKMVPNIAPKSDLTLFLSDYDIKDLKAKLTEYQIGLKHLKSLEPDDLKELCAYLQLSITQKIRFKFAVKDIQEKKQQNKSHNYHLGLTQSRSNEYELAPALLSDDEFINVHSDKRSGSKNDAVDNNNMQQTEQRYGPY